MGVEDIQKINKLAKDLLDSRMVSSREEAVREAQRILNKEIVNVTQKFEGESTIIKSDINYLKNIIIRTKEFTLQQLNLFKQEMEKIIIDINKLKADVEAMKLFGNKPSQGSAPEEKKQNIQMKLKEQKEEPHPRQGNYTSDDVAIDKIFYYGNKK